MQQGRSAAGADLVLSGQAAQRIAIGAWSSIPADTGELFPVADRACMRFNVTVRDGKGGVNMDDLGDYRPGRRAAAEFGVRSPLIEAGLSKAEIRELARRMDMRVWNKPALACLASRIPYGTRISSAMLQTVEQAEDILHRFNFQRVRVRHHGSFARIEIDRDEFSRLLSEDVAQEIISSLKALGFTYICLDLEGYRTGSTNEVLSENETRKFEV